MRSSTPYPCSGASDTAFRDQNVQSAWQQGGFLGHASLLLCQVSLCRLSLSCQGRGLIASRMIGRCRVAAGPGGSRVPPVGNGERRAALLTAGARSPLYRLVGTPDDASLPARTCRPPSYRFIINFGAPIRLFDVDDRSRSTQLGSFATGAYDSHVIVEANGSQGGMQIDFTHLRNAFVPRPAARGSHESRSRARGYLRPGWSARDHGVARRADVAGAFRLPRSRDRYTRRSREEAGC